MLVAATGLAVMVFEGIAIGLGAGNGFALLTAVLFALYAVILRSRRQREMLPTLLISAMIIIVVSALVQVDDLVVSSHDFNLEFNLGWAAFRRCQLVVHLRVSTSCRRRSNAVYVIGVRLGPIVGVVGNRRTTFRMDRCRRLTDYSRGGGARRDGVDKPKRNAGARQAGPRFVRRALRFNR